MESCKISKLAPNDQGYPIVSRGKNRNMGQHRSIYSKINKIKLKRTDIVMHTCDNKLCIEPTHLVLGTQLDNMRDKVNKNRQAKGESVGTSILTEKDVLEIREKYSPRFYNMTEFFMINILRILLMLHEVNHEEHTPLPSRSQ